MTSSKILITGGAGYLGSILVPALLDAGHHVHVLDNFTGDETSLLASCYHPHFQVTRGDCRETSVLQTAIAQADWIIPLAALVGAPACARDPITAQTLNLGAIQLLLKLKSSQQRVIYPTTNSGYGIGEKGKFCTEDSPLRPISLYGTTKCDAEKAVLDAPNTLTFRLATVFGAAPRMRTDLLVNDFVLRALRDGAVILFEGHAKRNYIHVRDVARAFQHAMIHFETMAGMPYNVGLSNANLSKIELCQTIQKQIPRFVYMEAPIGEDPDKRDYIVSNERIEKTGFKAKYSLDDGIRELIQAYQMIRTNRYANV